MLQIISKLQNRSCENNGILQLLQIKFIEDLYLMDKNETDLDKEFLKLSYDIAKFYEEFMDGSKPYLKSEKGKEQLKILKVKIIIYNAMFFTNIKTKFCKMQKYKSRK